MKNKTIIGIVASILLLIIILLIACKFLILKKNSSLNIENESILGITGTLSPTTPSQLTNTPTVTKKIYTTSTPTPTSTPSPTSTYKQGDVYQYYLIPTSIIPTSTYTINTSTPTPSSTPTVDNSALLSSLQNQLDSTYANCAADLQNFVDQRDAELLVFTRECGRRGIPVSSGMCQDEINTINLKYSNLSSPIQTWCDQEIARLNAQIEALQ